MSIRNAIAHASKEALAAYLSPELCDQLVDEIVHRASAELEGSAHSFWARAAYCQEKRLTVSRQGDQRQVAIQ